MENRIISNEYSIVIVTYINRYYAFFKPLLKNIIEIFPDKEIVIIINGHHDKNRNLQYLKEITNFLKQFINVRYFSWEDHQSLSKCWNWGVIMSGENQVLILNDDLIIKNNFRREFEKIILNNKGFFAINNSWSHFVISKSIIKKVGWFDERFLGIGQEDGDYLLRMTYYGIKPISIRCAGIENLVVPQDPDSSYSKISSSEIIEKYADINYRFMSEKWHFNHINGEESRRYDINCYWNNEILKATLKKGMETPIFYDFSLLEYSEKKFAPKSIKIVRNNFFKKIFKKIIYSLNNDK